MGCSVVYPLQPLHTPGQLLSGWPFGGGQGQFDRSVLGTHMLCRQVNHRSCVTRYMQVTARACGFAESVESSGMGCFTRYNCAESVMMGGGG
jgi:hypothetical protein